MDGLALFAHDPRSPLLFNSGAFFLLFTVFVAVHAALRGRNRARIAWLLAFSLYFYYRSNGAYTLALVGLATADFWIALRLHAAERPAARKAWLATSVTLNLLGLGVFKYTNFVLGNLAALAGRRFEPVSIFLPLGISFHVFQSISYLVDVYRRRYAPTRSLPEYASPSSRSSPRSWPGPSCGRRSSSGRSTRWPSPPRTRWPRASSASSRA